MSQCTHPISGGRKEGDFLSNSVREALDVGRENRRVGGRLVSRAIAGRNSPRLALRNKRNRPGEGGVLGGERRVNNHRAIQKG